MLFKNLLIFRFETPFELSENELREKLEAYPLTGCLSQELQSVGWVSAFSQGALVQGIENCYFIKMGIESKIMPAAAIKSEVEKKAQALGEPIETRSQYKEMEERVIAEILPKALTQKHTISAYIDIKKQWLVIDASSAKKGSDLTSLLRKTLGSLSIIPYAPETVISTVMTHWLMHGFYSKAFTCLPEVEIKELSEAAGTVKIKGVDLTSEDVLNHVQKGWQVTKMAFDYQERLQFALGEDFIFKRMKYLDNFQEDIESQDEPLLYQQTSAHLMVKEYREFIQNFIDVIAGNER